MLKGEWTSYEVVLAQIANLSPAQGRSVEALNNAAETLDLPGFELQWQPQISLVGGYIFQMSNAPRYDAVYPPLIQVQGVWNDPLTIIYERWKEDSKSFHVLETTTLPRQQEPKHYILHPPLPSKALRQRHRVRVGDNTLAQWYTEVETSVVHPLRLQGILNVTFEGEEIKEPTYRHLIEGNLNIQAWPFADLTLFGTNGSQQKQQFIHLGDTGNVSLPWRETVLSSLSSGNISISLLWNNLPVSPVVKCLADERIILPDAIEAAFRPNDPDILDAIVEVRRKSPVRLLALVLGPQPWNHQIWSQNMVIGNDGIATASITTRQKEACWIIICAQRNGQKPEALVAKRIAEVSDCSTPFLARPIGPSLRQWQDIVKFISIIPLPIDLYRLVQRQQLYQLLGRKEFEQLAIATWEDISTTAKVERLQNWQQMGVDVPFGLCEWVPADSSRNPYANVLIPDDLSCFKRMINHACLTTDVREIKEGGRHYAWPDGKLYIVDDEGEIILRLRSRDFLGACIQCRVVLPGHSFSSHQHLCKVGVLCLNSRGIPDRRDMRVYLAARFDGCDLLGAVARHLKAIVAESADDLPDKITSLLEDKLYNYFEQSGFADERTWLLGLSQAIDTLTYCLSSVDNSKLTDQEIKKVTLYQDALLSIVHWIQEN
ncbi:MAG: hypothetical protein HGA87_03785 [Desulfobulbaceae bacterium]|nr:hypothetical protein [Desulfobulbaceae bacterium]